MWESCGANACREHTGFGHEEVAPAARSSKEQNSGGHTTTYAYIVRRGSNAAARGPGPSDGSGSGAPSCLHTFAYGS